METDPTRMAMTDRAGRWVTEQVDALYRCRRLLTKAKERLDEKGHDKLQGLLRAGDPHGDVATCWEAKPRSTD